MRAFSIGVSTICAFLAGAVSAANAQLQYPARPITMIVPFAAGGPTDVPARIAPPPGQRTPKVLADLMRSEVAKWVPLIRAAGAVGE